MTRGPDNNGHAPATPFAGLVRRITGYARHSYISVRYKLLAIFLFFFILSTAIITSVVYIFISNMIERNASASNINLLSHIGGNISSILNDVHETSMFMLTNDDLIKLLQSDQPASYDMMKVREQVYRSLISRVVVDSKTIDSVEVLGDKGENILVNQYTAGSQNNADQIKYAKNLFNSDDWVPDGQLGYFLNTGEGVTFLRMMRNIDNLSQPLGRILITVSRQRLTEAYGNRLLYKNSFVYVVDRNGLIISSSQPGNVGSFFDREMFESIRRNPEGYNFKVSIAGEPSRLYYQELERYGWYVVNIVPVEELLRENSVIWRYLISTIVFCSVASILLVILYLKKVLAPLDQVSTAMKEIERENYSVQILQYKNDEIGNMAKNFNHMAQKLNDLVNLVYSFEIKQRDAQITILRSQMDPHFLYNVLDVIVWKSRSEQALETAEITRELSLYLRKSMNRNDMLITVRDELEHLTHYINLQRIRLADSVEFSIEVEDDMEENRIIGWVLQPLVENALNYGIASNGGVGCVKVRVIKQDDRLVMEVQDDGEAEPDISEINRLMQNVEKNQRGFAIKNINDRIHLLFGGNYGLSYTRTEDGTTIARVVQPLTTE